MALLRITAAEMVQLSAPWVAPNDAAHQILMSIPLLAALEPQVEVAHQLIVSMIPAAESPKIKELSATEAEVDDQHDTLVRGIHGGLSSMALVSANGAELISLRELLLPDGLLHTQRSYRGEAGHAALLEPRLDTATRQRLAAVKLHDRTLEALVDEWLKLAKQLGELEEQKARLVGPVGNTALEISQARYGWIRVAKALLANAELAQINEEQDRVLFAALRAAEITANRRKRGRSGAVDAPATEAPAVTPSNA
jgi:hypothetical protein